MASGHMNRVKRPDTWLHRPMLQNVKKVLANPEQATHDPTDAGAGVEPRSAKINFCGIFGVVRFSTLQHYPRVSGHRQTSQSGPKSANKRRCCGVHKPHQGFSQFRSPAPDNGKPTTMSRVVRSAGVHTGERLRVTSAAARSPVSWAPCAVEKNPGEVASPAKNRRPSTGAARTARSPKHPGRA